MLGVTTKGAGVRRILVAALLGTTSLLSAAAWQPAIAQDSAGIERSVTFAIAAQPLGGAIVAFSRTADIDIIADGAIPSGLQSGAVSGTLPIATALDQLLSGTGFGYRVTGPRSIALVNPNAAPVSYDGSIVLETIDVTAWVQSAATGSGFQGTPDWVYEAPESVSVIGRDAIHATQVRDTRDLMSGVSGVYSGEGNGSFPTVSPNIRGLQDSGRVVISIDGARQNAQRGVGVGSSGYQSNSGQAYVDSAFVSMVEVDKNPGASSGNAGSLGGSVTFRTIGADDLIAEGNNYGLAVNLTRGTNAYNSQDSILGAVRLADTPFSITAGISGLDLGEYKVGQNGVVAVSGDFKGRQNWSSLLKLEGDFGEAQTTLSWMHQQSAFKYSTAGFSNSETVANDSLTGHVSWDPVDNDLVDLDARLWLNNLRNQEVREPRTGLSGAPETMIDLATLSFGGSLENTSFWDTGLGLFTLNYGVEAFQDVATADANSTSLTANPTWESRYTAFSPASRRTMVSGFVDAELQPADWVTLSGGLRYDWHRLQGSPVYYNLQPAVKRFATAVLTNYAWRQSQGLNPAAAPPPVRAAWQAQWGEVYGNTFYPVGSEIPALSMPEYYRANELLIDRTDAAVLPTITAEFEPVDWFRPYISYSHSSRPPTILETTFAGAAPADGPPGTSYAPNISLRAEQARTWEVGANVTFDELLLANDSLRLKVSAFSREIDDYVVLGNIVAPGVNSKMYSGFVNLDGVTTMRGLEIEGNYDARDFWLGGSATWLETAWPQSAEIVSNGVISSDGKIIGTSGNVPPRFKLTLDGGVRLFEERLLVGARLTHVTPTLSREISTEGGLKELSEAYTTLDLYGSFDMSENATLRLAINNVTDLRYVPASGAYAAPGRTFLGSLNLKF